MSNFKKFGILAGLALALVFVGYGAGRYSAPAKVVTVEKVRVETKTEIVKVVDEEATRVAIANLTKQKDVHKKTVKVTSPDGTVTVTTESEDKTKTDSQTKTTEAEKSKTTETQKETVLVEHTTIKTVERDQPNWRVSVMPGYDVVGAVRGYEHYNLVPDGTSYLHHVVVGASVEHRLIGPLSTGIWGTTQGIVGATFSLEF